MATKIKFNREIKFEYGVCDQVSPLVRRVIANNPGPFTYTGTGTYIIGQGEVAVIDPGPAYDDHIDAILAATTGEKISHILITHTHEDHSPGAAPLKSKTGAKTYGFGPHGAGKLEEGVQIEAGGDMSFTPDVTVRHGDIIEGKGWTFECVYTPGHTSNHICFALQEEKALFSGDHIMGWSTSVIGPPDGDMTAYFESLRMLLDRDDEIYWPTHGSPITEPKPFVQSFIDHRNDREVQIIEAISAGCTDIKDMVKRMYADVDVQLHRPAAMSVLAHLQRMVGDGRLKTDSTVTLGASYSLP